MSRSIEHAILGLLAQRPPGATLWPSEAARAAAVPAEAEDWRRLMPQVRAASVGLARAGRLVIDRKGRPAGPETFKGVYRLRLP